MKPKATVVLVVMVFLFGIITIINSIPAYAASSEKIFLIQKFEQFPGQKITGFCNLEIDDQGNLNWKIKVYGLEPETQGHFDLGHWAGEGDVPFTANSVGEADSKNQIVLAKDFSEFLFNKMAKCQVQASESYHYPGSVIALGELGSGNEDTVEIKKSIPDEKKFFLFAAFDYFIAVLTNNNLEAKETKNPVKSEDNPPNLPKVEKNQGTDKFSGLDPVSSPILTPPNSFSGSTDKAPPEKPTDKGPSEKPSEKAPTEKPSDKAPSEKPTDKAPSEKPTDKAPSKKPADKDPSKKENENKNSDSKKCNHGKQKKGSC